MHSLYNNNTPDGGTSSVNTSHILQQQLHHHTGDSSTTSVLNTINPIIKLEQNLYDPTTTTTMHSFNRQQHQSVNFTPGLTAILPLNPKMDFRYRVKPENELNNQAFAQQLMQQMAESRARLLPAPYDPMLLQSMPAAATQHTRIDYNNTVPLPANYQQQQQQSSSSSNAYKYPMNYNNSKNNHHHVISPPHQNLIHHKKKSNEVSSLMNFVTGKIQHLDPNDAVSRRVDQERKMHRNGTAGARPRPRSCHQCKTKKNPNEKLWSCKWDPTTGSTKKRKSTIKRVCRKQYCLRCLSKYTDQNLYRELPKTEEQCPAQQYCSLPRCPACLHKCICSQCVRKHEKSGTTPPRVVVSSASGSVSNKASVVVVGNVVGAPTASTSTTTVRKIRGPNKVPRRNTNNVQPGKRNVKARSRYSSEEEESDEDSDCSQSSSDVTCTDDEVTESDSD